MNLSENERNLILMLASLTHDGYHTDENGQQFSIWKSPEGAVRAMLCGRFEVMLKKITEEE